MARPNIEPHGDEVKNGVEQYADMYGLRMSRAYSELLRFALREKLDWDDPYVDATMLAAEDGKGE